MRIGPILPLILLALLVQSCASASTERFLGLGWNSTRAEVLDSLDRWRFSYNGAKARWEGGTTEGFAVDKLKLGFDSTERLNFIEVHHQRLDRTRSEEVRKFWYERTLRAHGEPTSHAQTGEDQQRLSRWLWQFSDPESQLQDMIILVHFPDNVTYQAGKNLPAPFDISK